MDMMIACCAGLDVHKASVAVCVSRLVDGKGHETLRSFGTTTREILEMSDWLAEQGVTHVAMESTGVFWKPIWNLLEGRFKLLLCNAQHIKQVPGRKTDVKDCQWIAQLLQHGLLRGSFVPPRPMRELRDLTRQRRQLRGESTRAANRIHKVLEDANIKLGSVASDILGVSGRKMIEAIINRQTDEQRLAELACGRLRDKLPQLREALAGRVTAHHRFMLQQLYEHLRYLDGQVEAFNRQIEQAIRKGPGPQPDKPQGEAQPNAPQAEASATPSEPAPSATQTGPLGWQQAVELLDGIPGVDRRVAECLVAEIGTQMEQFPSEHHLASWAGMCPGNNRSAGTQRSGKCRQADRWLRGALSQAAWAAARTKDTYLSAQFRRLGRSRGRKRAIVAVGHSILIIAYQILRTAQPYCELGGDYFDRREPQRLTRYLVRRLESLGHTVTLDGPAAA